jgi:uncharacterized membrane protein YbjE (DUF340 family)
MKGSLFIVGFFVCGCLVGCLDIIPHDLLTRSDISSWVLYLLMFQVGMSVGSDKQLKQILASVKPRIILVPIATIAGTLLFSAMVGIFLSRWRVVDCMAVGSGFGYYSLSSILITKLKEPTIGLQLASELGTIALLSNIFRELFTLLGTPLLVKYFGRLAPICVGGATTADTTLPIITQYCGKDLVFISVFHGMLGDLTVPFFVSLFCSI